MTASTRGAGGAIVIDICANVFLTKNSAKNTIAKIRILLSICRNDFV